MKGDFKRNKKNPTKASKSPNISKRAYRKFQSLEYKRRTKMVVWIFPPKITLSSIKSCNSSRTSLFFFLFFVQEPNTFSTLYLESKNGTKQKKKKKIR
jgi:hypothetical protein